MVILEFENIKILEEIKDKISLLFKQFKKVDQDGN